VAESLSFTIDPSHSTADLGTDKASGQGETIDGERSKPTPPFHLPLAIISLLWTSSMTNKKSMRAQPPHALPSQTCMEEEEEEKGRSLMGVPEQWRI
jgi:hypothetical protein